MQSIWFQKQQKYDLLAVMFDNAMMTIAITINIRYNCSSHMRSTSFTHCTTSREHDIETVTNTFLIFYQTQLIDQHSFALNFKRLPANGATRIFFKTEYIVNLASTFCMDFQSKIQQIMANFTCNYKKLHFIQSNEPLCKN